MSSDYYQALACGITLIDTGYCRTGLAACYLIEQNGQAVFVDTGTYHAVPRLLQLLEMRGLGVEQVAYIIPTHVHLDHAGGAGELMRRMPNARLIVHPRGARHLIDPTILEAGAKAVYGDEQFQVMFGELIPVDAARVLLAADGFKLDFNGRELVFRDTPGHARHHFCIYDAVSQGIFTGDTFGISYRELDADKEPYILPTTTPVQFEPQAWLQSLDILTSYSPERLYLTHFGEIRYTYPLGEALKQGITQYAEIAQRYASQQNRQQKIKDALQRRVLDDLRARNLRLSDQQILDILELDLELNTQGLIVWLERQAKNGH